MTIVTINKEWRVNIDSWNHTLERYNAGGEVIPQGKYKGQLSKPSWVTEGYYPNLKQCLRRVRDVMASEGLDCDLNRYILRLEALDDDLKVGYEELPKCTKY